MKRENLNMYSDELFIEKISQLSDDIKKTELYTKYIKTINQIDNDITIKECTDRYLEKLNDIENDKDLSAGEKIQRLEELKINYKVEYNKFEQVKQYYKLRKDLKDLLKPLLDLYEVIK